MKRLISILMIPVTLIIGACSSPTPNRNPVGQMFPTVTGTSLTDRSVTLPKAWAGQPVLLMVGYVQETQFDLDRWTIGLVQVKFPCGIVEVPAIPGLVPSMISGTIDNGMRSGIPKEDWESVVTLYGGAAEPVVALTGNQNPRNGRIIMLDKTGKIVWFWDQGFSAKRLVELDTLARTLTQ